MKSNNYIFGFLILIILLILLILCHRNYVKKYCKNDIKCLKDKLIFNLNELGKKMDKIPKEQIQENFFGGLSNFFSGSSQLPPQLPVSPGSLPNENLNILEKKLNDNTKKSASFPPSDNDFKDSDNNEVLKSLGAKPYLTNPSSLNNNNNLNNIKKEFLPNFNKKESPSIPLSNINIPKPDVKSLLGNCQFYNDKCPDNYHPLGNFSIGGNNSGLALSCGNVQNSKSAFAIAQIKNNSISDIHIIDKGHGYNPENPPKVLIESGKNGNGATAEAYVDENGFLKNIKVIHPGYNYSETPKIIIDSPNMNSSCHLCCKND